MKIIVTGGAGFIGSHLVDKLVERGDEVLVIDDFSTGKEENLAKSRDKITIFRHDISQTLEGALCQPFFGEEIDCLIHLAALARVDRSMDNPVSTFKANVLGTVNVLELARHIKLKKFIFGSSSSVYGAIDEMPLTEDITDLKPRSPYAFQKRMCELLCQSYKQTYGVNTIMLRFFNVYGPRMPLEGAYKLVMPIWISQIKKGRRLTIYGDGEQTRDFTYIDDAVSGIIAVFEMGEDIASALEMPINLCTNIETSINELAEFFNWGTEYIDNPRPNEEKRKVGSNERAKQLLDWKPSVSILEGIDGLKQEHGI